MKNIGEQIMGSKQTATKVDFNSGGPSTDNNRHQQVDVKECKPVDLSAIEKCMGRR